MNFVLPTVIATCPLPTSGTFSPVTVLIEFRLDLIFSDDIFSDGKRVEFTIVMLLPVSIVARHGAFSTSVSTKFPWKFSDCPLSIYFEVLFSIAGSRPLVNPAIARFPCYLYHAIRIVPLTPIMLNLTSLPATSPRIRTVANPVSLAVSFSRPKRFLFPGRNQDNFFADDLHDMSKTS